uniref:Uncharacterized protein n=1 Tax=Arundo donax TaxID=35708 RepID=A0A0A9H339_ARUDO
MIVDKSLFTILDTQLSSMRSSRQQEHESQHPDASPSLHEPCGELETPEEGLDEQNGGGWKGQETYGWCSVTVSF